MATSRRPISFIATTAPKEAKAFYGNVLGLTLVEESPFALVFDDGGNMLRVQIVAALAPVSHTAHGWQVSDITKEIAALTGKGVSFLRFDQLAQDALSVWTTPDGSKIAWFKDPSGNILSLTEFV